MWVDFLLVEMMLVVVGVSGSSCRGKKDSSRWREIVIVLVEVVLVWW